jgi:methyl-accepting chemotaxis protein
MSLKIRLIIILFFLFSLSIGTSAYLYNEANATQIFVEQQVKQAEFLEHAEQLKRDLEKMVFWLTEMSLSLNPQSKERAFLKRKEAEESLRALYTHAPKVIKKLRSAIPKIFSAYLRAHNKFIIADNNAGRQLLEVADKAAISMDVLTDELFLIGHSLSDNASDKITSYAKNSINFAKVLFVISILIVGGAIYFILAWLITPMQSITYAMTKLSDGQLETEVPYLYKSDEIGKMANALSVFKENSVERIHLEQQQQQQQKHTVEHAKTISHHTTGFEGEITKFLGTMSGSIRVLQDISTSLASLATGNGTNTLALSNSSQSVSRNMQSISAAAEELSATGRSISSEVSVANTMVSDAVSQMTSADHCIKDLTRSYTQIISVVQVISDISGQINLLALNATIESARAGEAGKGFAVVAGEVKRLARQTDDLVGQIEEVLGEMELASDNIVTAMDDIQNSINKINESSSSIAAAVEEQSTTTSEIAKNIQNTAKESNDITQNIEGISTNSQETNQKSQDLKNSSDELAKNSDSLNRVVHSFLSNVSET